MGTTEKYKRYAKRIKIFNGLSAEEVSDILHRGRMVEFRDGQTIFHAGQRGSTIFIVFSGVVDIYVTEKIIAKCRIGDAFGEMSVLNHRPHCATAVAHTDVKLFVIDESDINDILSQHAAVRFLLNIIHVLSGHLEVANTSIADLRKKLTASA